MPERDPKAEAAVLTRKAEDDARAMQLLAPNQEISDEIVGFHAQQAVEKWLKALLDSRGIAFEYTLYRGATVALVDEIGGWVKPRLK